MSIVTKESNPELYNALFENSTIEVAKEVIQNMFNDITPEQFEELKKQAIENVKKNNMSAKEMFEKLGYEKTSDIPLCYCFNDGGYVNLIEFVNSRQEIIFTEYEEYNENKPQGSFALDKKELQAINKQVEELGWNE